MKVTTSARHGSICDQTRERFEAKVEKLGRNFDQVTEVNILVDLANRETPKLDVTVKQNNGPDAIATIDNKELMIALDLALDKLEQQLRKSKEKKIDRYQAAGELPTG